MRYEQNETGGSLIFDGKTEVEALALACLDSRRRSAHQDAAYDMGRAAWRALSRAARPVFVVRGPLGMSVAIEALGRWGQPLSDRARRTDATREARQTARRLARSPAAQQAAAGWRALPDGEDPAG